jgi:hypothetical protein
MPKKTQEVADLLGVKYYQLRELIRCRKIAPPPKDASGDYAWTEAAIDAARQVIAARRRSIAASA